MLNHQSVLLHQRVLPSEKSDDYLLAIVDFLGKRFPYLLGGSPEVMVFGGSSPRGFILIPADLPVGDFLLGAFWHAHGRLGRGGLFRYLGWT